MIGICAHSGQADARLHMLPAGASLVLAADSDAFLKRYGFNAYGEFAGALNNKGDDIALIDTRTGHLLDAVVYNNQL